MKKTLPQAPALADISSEQIVLSPERDGIEGIPAVSHSVYSTNWKALPLHAHADIELCFCSRGSLVFECEGRTHRLLPNNVFITQPGDRHHLTTNHKGMRMYWLFFRYPRTGHSILGLSVRETEALTRRLRAISAREFAVDPSMRQLFRDVFKFHAELEPGPYRTLVLRNLLLQILLMTIRSADNRPTVKALATISNLATQIANHPARRFSVAELAHRVRLSESHFSALFRQVIGMPPYAYLSTCRLQTAKKILSDSSTPISAIAAKLGFSSAQHLATQFRKTYGATPSAWRTVSQKTLRGDSERNRPEYRT